jgi:adenylate kinase family enzyme
MKTSGKTNFLIDGFPRNKDNVDGWKQTMDDKANIQCVLFFDCDEQVGSLSTRLDRSVTEFRRASRDVWNESKGVDERMTIKRVSRNGRRSPCNEREGRRRRRLHLVLSRPTNSLVRSLNCRKRIISSSVSMRAKMLTRSFSDSRTVRLSLFLLLFQVYEDVQSVFKSLKSAAH